MSASRVRKCPQLVGAKKWSAATRPSTVDDSFAELVLEHREPLNLILSELVAQSPQSAAELATILDTRIHTVVITKENARLTAARLRDNTPAGWQTGDAPWARYRAIGPDPEQFERAGALSMPSVGIVVATVDSLEF